MFIQERQGHSGQSADSLFSLFLHELLRPIQEQGNPKPANQLMIDVSFFSTKRRRDVEKRPMPGYAPRIAPLFKNRAELC